MAPLKPAAKLAAAASKPYPNDSDAYRKARTLLLYRGLAPDGSEWPALDVWVKRDGKVRHFWGAELGAETVDSGQDPRGAPDPTPLWNLLDLTPAGRGTDWYPKLEYPKAA